MYAAGQKRRIPNGKRFKKFTVDETGLHLLICFQA